MTPTLRLSLALSLAGCANEADPSSAGLRALRQDVQVAEVQEHAEGQRAMAAGALAPGWFFPDLPLDMARDLLGEAELQACLDRVVAGGFCQKAVPPCALLWLYPGDPEPRVVLQLHSQGCREAAAREGSAWMIATGVEDGRVVAWEHGPTPGR